MQQVAAQDEPSSFSEVNTTKYSYQSRTGGEKSLS